MEHHKNNKKQNTQMKECNSDLMQMKQKKTSTGSESNMSFNPKRCYYFNEIV